MTWVIVGVGCAVLGGVVGFFAAVHWIGREMFRRM